jgi:hypothetical protein
MLVIIMLYVKGWGGGNNPALSSWKNYVSPTASLDVPAVEATVKNMYKVVNRFNNIVKESRQSLSFFSKK